jgi:hypothetical protein
MFPEQADKHTRKEATIIRKENSTGKTQMVGWLVGRLSRSLVGWLLAGSLVGWLDGWVPPLLAYWLIGWLT